MPNVSDDLDTEATPRKHALIMAGNLVGDGRVVGILLSFGETVFPPLLQQTGLPRKQNSAAVARSHCQVTWSLGFAALPASCNQISHILCFVPLAAIHE